MDDKSMKVIVQEHILAEDIKSGSKKRDLFQKLAICTKSIFLSYRQET